MFKKTFLMATVALSALAASAAIPSVTLKDMNGKTVDTATLSNDGKPFDGNLFIC